MAQKPEIQYVGQFYVYGSEAKELAPARRHSRQKQNEVLVRQEPQRQIVVDPVALVGLVVAVVMLATLVVGALQIRATWQEYHEMEVYLSKLDRIHDDLEDTYQAGYNLEDIQATAIALGMIPASDAELITIQVELPQPEPEPPFWEEILWFLDGLFA